MEINTRLGNSSGEFRGSRRDTIDRIIHKANRGESAVSEIAQPRDRRLLVGAKGRAIRTRESESSVCPRLNDPHSLPFTPSLCLLTPLPRCCCCCYFSFSFFDTQEARDLLESVLTFANQRSLSMSYTPRNGGARERATEEELSLAVYTEKHLLLYLFSSIPYIL